MYTCNCRRESVPGTDGVHEIPAARSLIVHHTSGPVYQRTRLSSLYANSEWTCDAGRVVVHSGDLYISRFILWVGMSFGYWAHECIQPAPLSVVIERCGSVD